MCGLTNPEKQMMISLDLDLTENAIRPPIRLAPYRELESKSVCVESSSPVLNPEYLQSSQVQSLLSPLTFRNPTAILPPRRRLEGAR